MDTERRKFKRLLPRDLTFAVFRPHFANLGKVKDISKGGLALEYVLNETKITGFSEIDIFLSGYPFYMSRIPSKIIYDKNINGEYRTEGTRQCGLKFEDLAPEQTSQLQYFLRNYTKGKWRE